MGQSSRDVQGYSYLKAPVKRRRASKLLYVVAAILFSGVLVTFVNIYQLRAMQYDHGGPVEVEAMGQTSISRQHSVWVHGNHVDSGYLKHVLAVFNRIGYSRGSSSSWDVLWAHDYPFTVLKDNLAHLKPTQRVNHWPGSGFVTNKLNLATSDIKNIPKAFKIPSGKQQFMDYASAHPDVKWVQKNANHRGVHVLSKDELDLNSEGTFVQEYVDDPLLIDGRRFDIGVYTTLASINPLRVYINEGDWLIRFCPKEYYPFDASNRDKYVVHDKYMPLWEMDSLKPWYVEQKHSFRETLLAYLRSKSMNVDKLLKDIRETIQSVYIIKEELLIKSASKYKSTSHFFEMVRFDFVLDKNLNIYLMEVNMSPNLSSGHFPPNKLLYEQTVFGMLHLVGVARATDNALSKSMRDEDNMLVSERDIQIHSDACVLESCRDNCKLKECRLCGDCFTGEQTFHAKRAYEEHVNRRNWRRVLPVSWGSQQDARQWKSTEDKLFQSLTTRNRWMNLWFHGKCLQDATWCT